MMMMMMIIMIVTLIITTTIIIIIIIIITKQLLLAVTVDLLLIGLMIHTTDLCSFSRRPDILQDICKCTIHWCCCRKHLCGIRLFQRLNTRRYLKQLRTVVGSKGGRIALHVLARFGQKYEMSVFAFINNRKLMLRNQDINKVKSTLAGASFGRWPKVLFASGHVLTVPVEFLTG